MANGVWAETVRGMLLGFDAIGIDTDEILLKAGIDSAQLDDLFAVVPGANAAALLVHAHGARAEGDAALRAAAAIGPSGYTAIDHLILSAPTLGEAIETLIRFHDAISTYVSYRVERLPTARRVRWSHSGLSGLLELIVRDFSLAATIIRFQRASSGFAATVELHGRPLAERSRYREVFGADVRFECPSSALVVTDAVWDHPLPESSSSLHTVLREHAQAILELAPRRELVERAHGHLVHLLSRSDATVSSLAARLGLSSRTLQRRLAEHGVPFHRLLGRARLSLAQMYLLDPTLSLEDVSSLLGYTEHRSFSRAFSAWTGRTPSEYRRSQRFPEPS